MSSCVARHARSVGAQRSNGKQRVVFGLRAAGRAYAASFGPVYLAEAAACLAGARKPGRKSVVVNGSVARLALISYGGLITRAGVILAMAKCLNVARADGIESSMPAII